MDKKKVHILIEKEDLKKKTIYTIKTIFSFINYGFKLRVIEEQCQINPLDNNNILIYIGSHPNEYKWCDLVIPKENYNNWKSGKIGVTYLNDIPVLYAQDKPEFFLKENILGFDLLNLIFYLLSRQEEYLIPKRDQWGRFPYHESCLYKKDIIDKPIIDYYMKHLKQLLGEIANNKNLQLESVNTWKDNKKFAVSLTHDVDFLFLHNFRYGVNLLKRSLRHRLNGFLGGMKHAIVGLSMNMTRKKDPLWTLEQLMSLEDRFGWRSTFFFSAQEKEPHLDDPYYKMDDEIQFRNKKCKINEIIRYMDNEGWEIGLHGSLDSLYKDNLLLEEKKYLANILDKNRLGNRQHLLRLDTTSCWRIFEQADLSYDTSLGYIDKLGYRAGTGFPFYAYDLTSDSPSQILELPLIFIEGVLEAQENMNEEKAFKICLHYINEAETTGGMVNILWHTHNLYPKKCKVDWNLVYRRVLEELDGRDAWIATLGEVVQWWQNKIQAHNRKIS